MDRTPASASPLFFAELHFGSGRASRPSIRAFTKLRQLGIETRRTLQAVFDLVARVFYRGFPASCDFVGLIRPLQKVLQPSLEQAFKAVLLASGHRFQLPSQVLPIQESGSRRSQRRRLMDQPFVKIQPYVR